MERENCPNQKRRQSGDGACPPRTARRQQPAAAGSAPPSWFSVTHRPGRGNWKRVRGGRPAEHPPARPPREAKRGWRRARAGLGGRSPASLGRVAEVVDRFPPARHTVGPGQGRSRGAAVAVPAAGLFVVGRRASRRLFVGLVGSLRSERPLRRLGARLLFAAPRHPVGAGVALPCRCLFPTNPWPIGRRRNSPRGEWRIFPSRSRCAGANGKVSSVRGS